MPTSAGMLLTSLALASTPTAPEGEGSTNDPAPTFSRLAADDDRRDQPWIQRWRPERNTYELGGFVGVMFPHPRLELYQVDRSLPDWGFRRFRGQSPEFGLRGAYFPLRMLGLEGELGLLPARTETRDQALLWNLRGHVVAQLPWWSVTPFALAGVTALGVTSDRSVVGNDVDLGFHFGGGIKVFPTRRVAVRLDIRDTMTARRGVDRSVVHSPEILLGLSAVLGRSQPEPIVAPADSDGDGLLDPNDRCPRISGVVDYEGCPIPDTDGDGLLDPEDRCVQTVGVPEYQGCPIPDTDGDGLLDPNDHCVETAGVTEYQGCPIPDTDSDGLLDPDDRCPADPETDNGYQDEDGCPDEIPLVIKQFTGIIEGIYFRSNSATIFRKSRPQLDHAVEVLSDFPALRIEISGHTDDRSYSAHNLDLSLRRAEAVKQYMVDAGIDASRIETRGAGETEPVADNATEKGRARNRRIEFELISRK
ncbi:MAG: OmpA family protein [Myxococcota bacterium]